MLDSPSSVLDVTSFCLRLDDLPRLEMVVVASLVGSSSLSYSGSRGEVHQWFEMQNERDGRLYYNINEHQMALAS